jgi:pimeloyl-ACP methyl ester carboxylesterase
MWALVPSACVLVLAGFCHGFGTSCLSYKWQPAQKRGALSALFTATQPPPTLTESIDKNLVLPDVSFFEEESVKDTTARLRRVRVPVPPEFVESTGTTAGQPATVGISYVHWEGTKTTGRPALILVPGFDSSCLEYRRLGSRLASDCGVDTYAVDLLGWGFTQLDGVSTFSAAAKVEALNRWISLIVGPDTPFVIAGASLGGAAAIEMAVRNPMCCGLVLISAQGFVDGIGPMAYLPRPLARVGVEILRSGKFHFWNGRVLKLLPWSHMPCDLCHLFSAAPQLSHPDDLFRQGNLRH